MNEEEIIKQHFAKIGSKGGKAGTGESKRRKGSESNLKKYWEDVKAGRREPPKQRGRPRKTSKQLADAQPDSPTEAVKQEKPTVQKQTGKRTVSSKNGELRPWRPAEEIIREGREAAEKARKAKEKKVSYKPQTFASEMAQAVAEGDFEKVMKLRSGWKRTEPKVGPNSPCPCGSGKKFKKCCGRNN